MESLKLQSKLLVACIALVSFVSLLKGSYYMQDFFPIGFTGFNFTHHWTAQGTPYPEGYVYGNWLKEKELLDSTHCNFIGCADAWHNSYINWWERYTRKWDFYNEVCLPAIDKNITLNYNLCKTQTPWRES